jgi:hypothetical protein
VDHLFALPILAEYIERKLDELVREIGALRREMRPGGAGGPGRRIPAHLRRTNPASFD